MKKANFLLYIVISTFVTGCFGSRSCKKVDIPKDRLVWFSFYQQKDVLHFQSNQGNEHRFTVSLIDNLYTTCNRIEVGKYQFQNVTAIFKTSGGIADKNKELYIDIRSNLNGNNLNIYLFDFWVELSDDIRSEMDTIYVDGKIYEVINLGESRKRTRIDTISWNDECGIIQYTLKTGEIFTLVR